MYTRAYGIIETLAPLHVGATAGEESGNLNLIFRDQFTQTGIVPGSSLRGRLRSEMRLGRQRWLENELLDCKEKLDDRSVEILDSLDKEVVENSEDGREVRISRLKWLEKKARELSLEVPVDINDNYWYGTAADSTSSNFDSEAIVKLEYASVIWLPVFCPGQPIVWVSCPRLLERYRRIAGEHVKKDGKLLKELSVPKVGEYSTTIKLPTNKKRLFFNFGYMKLDKEPTLSSIWFPTDEHLPAIVVEDDEMGLIHDMALYRQTRVKLKEDEKLVDNFFNVEALPEGTILAFPVAIRKTRSEQKWKPFNDGLKSDEIYLGGLESIGFGNCDISIKGIK